MIPAPAPVPDPLTAIRERFPRIGHALGAERTFIENSLWRGPAEYRTELFYELRALATLLHAAEDVAA